VLVQTVVDNRWGATAPGSKSNVRHTVETDGFASSRSSKKYSVACVAVPRRKEPLGGDLERDREVDLDECVCRGGTRATGRNEVGR
jgi:hypothetical protein